MGQFLSRVKALRKESEPIELKITWDLPGIIFKLQLEPTVGNYLQPKAMMAKQQQQEPRITPNSTFNKIESNNIDLLVNVDKANHRISLLCLSGFLKIILI